MSEMYSITEAVASTHKTVAYGLNRVNNCADANFFFPTLDAGVFAAIRSIDKVCEESRDGNGRFGKEKKCAEQAF